MGNALLELKNIYTYYGNICALRDVSLFVKEGEIVSLIGSNGAGKSTTLRTISSLLHPKMGEILFNGQKINDLSPHIVAQRGIAHVPEGRKIFSKLTVRENLEMGAFSISGKNSIEKRMERVFGLFPRLKERIKQPGGTLSGGEQQMLAMGRALMANPKLLLLDEPSMGLAPILVNTIFETIQNLHKEGITILLIEQNASKALKIANRGYVLQTGSIVLTDTGEALLNNDMVRQAYLS